MCNIAQSGTSSQDNTNRSLNMCTLVVCPALIDVVVIVLIAVVVVLIAAVVVVDTQYKCTSFI